MNTRVVSCILGNEWRAMWRARIPPLLLALLILLMLMAGLASHHHWQHHAQTIAKANQQSSQDWQSQPDRHPHRVSHFGDFVAKPIHVLSTIEPGILDQSGHLVYLEAHRLNSANFNPATEATSLGRFPMITPAMVVQWLMPLVLMMAGYTCITREKHEGTLSYLLANGTRAIDIAVAKWLALLIPTLAVLFLLAAMLVYMVWHQPQGLMRLSIMLTAQTIYLAVWCLMIVVVSALSKHLHSALLTLLLLWVSICVISPKILINLAQDLYPTHARAEAEYAAEQKLRTIGDSHNPDDPHFAKFKADTLKRYGVNTVEALPVNYNGLLMQEGERLTTQVYREQQMLHQAQLARQNAWVRQWLWLSPALALQYIQMAASGSDLAHHQAFITQSEQRRYALISYLNRVHTEKVHAHNDKEQRIDAEVWKDAPRPAIQLAPVQVSTSALAAAFSVLVVWLMGALFVISRALKRL